MQGVAMEVSAAILSFLSLAAAAPPVPSPDSAAVIQGVDAAVQARVDNVLGFTDTEHYAVYRGNDESHPAAEMTVRDTYRKGKGKAYTVLSESGSSIIEHYGLQPLLDNETEINLPGQVAKSWFTSANYEMHLIPGAQQVNGRTCYAFSIQPRSKAPNMIEGTLWVDAGNDSIVRVKGIASKKPSIFAGTTHMMRDYQDIDGYSMATHARAESSSLFFGRTVVVIEYYDYHLQLRPKH
jgi:hypothetical protein